MMDFLYTWQGLLGSFVGASLPFSLWFFQRWFEKRNKRIEDIYFLIKVIVSELNKVLEIRRTIIDFTDKRLLEVLDYINEDNRVGRYAVGQAFFPLIDVSPITNDVLRIRTGSTYVDNQVAQILMMSKDFSTGIIDIKNQFDSTIELNRDFGLNKLNSVEVHNRQYQNNLKIFKDFVKRDYFEKNDPIYMKNLVKVRVILEMLLGRGLLWWKIKFDARYKFFLNKQLQIEYGLKTYDRIDAFFRSTLLEEYDSIEEKFRKSL